MTDLESPRKNNDCYFYYYSTCTKGDSCTFRHEPSALGCETTCSFWKEGKCINVHCNFRHMELRKNRKSIPCYWESQPGGCKKPHCPFMHTSAKSIDDGESSDLKSQDSKDSDACNKEMDYIAGSPAYRPLVVNFEEESDNESAPTQSPIKNQRVVKVKTLEEIRLERIQAESAAYYSYPDSVQIKEEENKDEDHLRSRIIRRLNTKQEVPQQIEVLSLNEIRKRKQRPNIRSETIPIKRQKISLRSSRLNDKAKNLTEIKIKTLEEIKNERAMRFASSKRKLEDAEDNDSKIMKIEAEESEVTSTSRIDAQNEEKVQCVVSPVQRLQEEENSQESNQEKTKTNLRLQENVIIKEENNRLNDENISEKDSVKEDTKISQKIKLSDEVKDINVDANCVALNEEKVNTKNVPLDSSKLDDFLLEEDDFETSVSLRAEEDILKDIDNLLNE